MDKVVGVVNKIVYYNEDNGYGIIKLKLDYKNPELEPLRTTLFSNILSVLCTFDRKPFEDEEYEFTGEIETSSYGYQLRAKTFNRINENSKKGIVTYLSSELFPNIGKVSAEKVYDALGKDALTLIVKDRSVLDKVDLTLKQKDSLYENLVIHYTKEKELVELLNIGIGMKTSVKIINTLGDGASKVIRENPYKLIDLVDGIAFLRADEIAKKMGFKLNNEKRLIALINYVLKTVIYQTGNSYVTRNDLFEKTINFANQVEDVINREVFDKLLKELVETKKIIIDENDFIYDRSIYFDEISLARNICNILKQDNNDYTFDKVAPAIEEVMKNNNITYSDKQQEAIEKALKEPIVIVTGGPGTGKSTVVKGIVEAYSSLFPKKDLIKNEIYLVAPTGRAAKRLKEVTDHNNASTIHKLLGYQGNGRFTAIDEGPIKAKMIIIDEFSMVDINLAAVLFKCILPTTKVVIVGDVDQLPAVGCGDVLRDLIESKEITTIRLDKIHRQASDSTIISLAHEVNEGNLPYSVIEKQHDRNFIPLVDEGIADGIVKVVKQGIDSGMDLVKDIQVLIPMYRGVVGIDAINFKLQDAFNNTTDQIVYNGKRFRNKDKVIQLVNRHEKQVMNGDIGYIRCINRDGEEFKSLDVQFDFGSVHYEKDELDDLSLAYAISIHKSQGSEFGLVVVPFSFKYYMMLKRKLIYTAITRAKKYLIMIGNIEALRRGITQIEEKRKTMLQERLHELMKNPNKIYDNSSAFMEIKENPKEENLSISDFMNAKMPEEFNGDFDNDNEIKDNNEEKDKIEMEDVSPFDFMDDLK